MTPNTPRLYDTLTRTEQPLTAGDGQLFRMYCCGPTVYGPAHIGNFRTFVLQDVLRRVVMVSGQPVLHVRNLTDVDDKTIRQSRAEGRRLVDFTAAWTERFHQDAARLNLLPPTTEPGAVAHIEDQIALITTLMTGGHAYAVEGSVYFRVVSFPGYGRLSRLETREIRTATSDSDEYERDAAADFVLWKARKPEDGDNFWPSPWGEGRPGWHIECSAMSLRYLGSNFDLHGGGADLMFPHHENEIAQSEAATGQPFSRLWMHTEHLTVDGRKMSKSLGNLHTLDDAVSRGHTPGALRYALLAGHYRKPLNFTWNAVAAAESAIGKLAKHATNAGLQSTSWKEVPGEFTHDFGPLTPVWEALADDLNTPEALGRLFSILPEQMATNQEKVRGPLAAILFALGLDPLAATASPGDAEIPDDIRELAEKRWAARSAKDWPAADALRGELAALGWEMKDGKTGYSLSRIRP